MTSSRRPPRRIITIDCQYLRPRFAAAYLLTEPGSGRAAFVDNNTTYSVPLLLEALSREGLRPDAVDYVIITHVHLDHAGGASALMKACPRARLLAHPRASRHMIDPSRLIASARQVYGDKAFESMYGRIEPIEASRVQSVEDGEEVGFGQGARLRFLHTRGHANHHTCIHEPETASVFTGDSFGLVYPDLQEKGLFIFPSTSPTDFDGPEAIASVDRILNTGARRAYPTHFGEVTQLEEAAPQLKHFLEASQALMLEAAGLTALTGPELVAFCERRLRARFEEEFRKRGLELSAERRELIELDVTLNAQGLAFVAQKRRTSESGGAPRSA